MNALQTHTKHDKFFDEILAFTINPTEADEQIRKGSRVMVIDVRESKDFIKRHVPNAINLSDRQWWDTSGWPIDWPLIVYGYSFTCPVADKAVSEFARQGFLVMEIAGGFETWQKNRLPCEV